VTRIGPDACAVRRLQIIVAHTRAVVMVMSASLNL